MEFVHLVYFCVSNGWKDKKHNKKISDIKDSQNIPQ